MRGRPRGARIDPERIVTSGYWVAGAAVLAQTLLHLVNTFLLDRRVFNFDADVEGNFLAWLSSAAIFTAALATLVLSVLERHRLKLAALAGILTFFSLDEVAGIHEEIGQIPVRLLDTSKEAGRLFWPALLLPLLAAALLLLRFVAARAPARARRAIHAALAMLVVAVIVEVAWVAWPAYWGDIGDSPDAVQVAVEEALELGAWIVIAASLVSVAWRALAHAVERSAR